MGCSRSGIFGIWDDRGMGYFEYGMLKMWDIGDLRCGLFGMWDVEGTNVRNVGGMFGMRDVLDVGCGMLDVCRDVEC